MNALSKVPFYLSVEHACSYLDGEMAQNLVADPSALSPKIYTRLAEYGFRRSGDFVYRPHCQACSECRPLRIPVQLFEFKRSFRRILRRNEDLRFELGTEGYTDERFQLYLRYLHARHANGGMDKASARDFQDFLTSRWCQTRFYDIRHGSSLLGVAVTDVLEDALSAIYTFFDPEVNERSLGTWAILRQIQLAREQGWRWLYLGYWVPGCQKMAYKARFRPHQIFQQSRWIAVR